MTPGRIVRLVRWTLAAQSASRRWSWPGLCVIVTLIVLSACNDGGRTTRIESASTRDRRDPPRATGQACRTSIRQAGAALAAFSRLCPHLEVLRVPGRPIRPLTSALAPPRSIRGTRFERPLGRLGPITYRLIPAGDGACLGQVSKDRSQFACESAAAILDFGLPLISGCFRGQPARTFAVAIMAPDDAIRVSVRLRGGAVVSRQIRRNFAVFAISRRIPADIPEQFTLTIRDGTRRRSPRLFIPDADARSRCVRG